MENRKLVSKAYYDKVAPSYDQHSHASYLGKLSAQILTTASSWGFDSALDVGCGTGSLLALLRNQGAKVAGADMSPVMIEKARKRLDGDADLRVADSESLPWAEETFSLVVCVGSFHHYPAPQKALSEMRRVLRREGHIIIADPSLPILIRQLANQFIGLSGEGATRMYSEAELRRMMTEVGFAEVSRAKVKSSAIVLSAAANK